MNMENIKSLETEIQELKVLKMNMQNSLASASNREFDQLELEISNTEERIEKKQKELNNVKLIDELNKACQSLVNLSKKDLVIYKGLDKRIEQITQDIKNVVSQLEG